MEFFKQIEAAGIKNAEIKIVEKNGSYSVSFMPKYDAAVPALSRLKPIVLTGKAEIIDEKFFEYVMVFTDNPEFSSNYESAKSAIAESAKEMIEKKKKDAEKPTKATAGKKSAAPKVEKEPEPEKPKPESKFKKYEDPILAIVETEGFVINDDNYSKLKDAVDMLSVMDRNSELAKTWEDKLKIYKKAKSSLFSEAEAYPVPETVSPEEAIAPPPPAEEESIVGEDDFVNSEEDDFDFDPFEDDDNGPTGHGDICDSDADQGL